MRVHPSGSKVYTVHKRSDGKSRRVTIGRHGVWSLAAARREAGGIITRLEKGETPGRPGEDSPSATGPTIAELAEQSMTDHVAVRCKPTPRSCRHILAKFHLPQSPTARKILANLRRQPDNPWVIVGRAPAARLSNLNATWGVVRKKAGLEDVRIHDLRHSYASRALSLGESLPMIGKLLGHQKVQTTAGYAHLARDCVKAAAEGISDSLETDLETTPNDSDET